MPKETPGLFYRITHLFTYHPWLKLIALGLAVMVWLYVNAEISRFNLPAKELWQEK